MNVGISSCAKHATASCAQTCSVAPHNGEELDGEKDHGATGNSEDNRSRANDHHGRAPGTSRWFAHAAHGKR